MKLSGVIPPMITPLNASGQVDQGGVERLVNHLITHGVAGIFVMGSSGEGPWLNRDQRQQLLRYTIDSAKGKVPILAGALEPGIGSTLDAVHLIADCGADAVVIASPYYFEADADAQIHHIQCVADASPLPIVLYNIPPMTHNPLVAETVAQILDMKNIIGIKDSAGDWGNFEALVKLKATRPDFYIWQGAEKLSAQSIIAGADGIVAGLANLVPDKFVDIVKNAQNQTIAHDIQDTIDQLWELHTHGFWLACLKYAGSLCGFGDGSLSIPTIALPDDAKNNVRLIVEAVGIQVQ